MSEVGKADENTGFYNNDTTVYTASVNVTKDAATNKLTCGEVTYKQGETAVNANDIVFKNTTEAPEATSVNLSANATNKLTCGEVTYKQGETAVNANDIVFKNTTEAPEATSVNLSAKKTVDGKAPTEGQTFSFSLTSTHVPDGATAIV